MVRAVLDPSGSFSWFSGGVPTHSVRRPLLVIAQISSLVAMATCYFLAPQVAWLYSIVAVGWYVSLAVPAATAGPLGAAGQRLIDASPGRRCLPGGTAYAWRIAVTLLVYFAAPAVVATLLPSPIERRSTEPWVALVSLVVVAGAIVGTVGLVGPSRRGLARMIAVATAVIILAVALALPGLPLLPRLP